MNLATAGRGFLHEGLAAGFFPGSVRAERRGHVHRTQRPVSTQGSRIRLLWKKPADSGLPGSWRKVSPSMRNLYSCDPGSSAIVVE